ncbi:hypothetical protein AU476_39285 [Cupriavidus sp. UYMSc13B]|nr:hypothetical protein AU476_39285 [Cupriavidus sp. UYMSc13B]
MTMSYQPRRAWLTAVLLFFFLVVNAMDKMVVGLLAAPMMDELGLTPAQFGLVGSSFFWLFAVSGVLGGFLANRTRPRGCWSAWRWHGRCARSRWRCRPAWRC